MESRKGTRLWRAAKWVLAVVSVLLIGVELYTRYWLGWCDVPLYMEDPQIEYMLRPNQECRVQRNLFATNAFGMRSGPMTERASDPSEVRILLVGDSVVNGGVHTDQSSLASTLLVEELKEATGLPVVVGNVSCSSWGPPNYLEYFRKYGLFDADVVVFVMTAGDSADVPTFEERVGKPAWPSSKPLMGTWSAVRRVLDRMAARRGEDRPALRDADRVPAPEEIEQSLGALREVIALARSHGAEVLIAQHLMKRELDGPRAPGHGMIKAVADELGVTTIELGQAFADAMARGVDPYRDFVHPNPTGYRITAEALRGPIIEALEKGGSDGRAGE